MKYKSSSSRSQKQKSHRRKNRSRRRSHTKRRLQRGGILNPSVLSNSSNSHIGGKGFTDPQGAVTGCTGSSNSADALRGSNIFTTIGGIKIPVMKGGQNIPCFTAEGGQVNTHNIQKGGRRRTNKRKYNRSGCGGMSMRFGPMKMSGGGSVHNTNGYSIGGIDLKPSLSGIANNYHTAYDSCKV